MTYRPEIDGLRAIAVLPVILFHAGFDLFSGGYVGVDVFFVISGYLITGIIIDDLEKGRFSIAHFYERRARRILPALYFVMACCIPFAWVLMDPYELKEFAQSLVATSLFLSNVFFFLKSDYFDVASEEKPLLHTWSLAVEEQFYIVFPLLLLLLWRRKRLMVVTIVVLLLTSLLSAERGWRIDPSWNFYLPFARVWELMTGSLCALAMRYFHLRSNNVFAGLGLAALLAAVFLYDASTPFPSLYSLVPVAGTALVILFGTPTSGVGRILAAQGPVSLGLISYSAYLWHQPILAFLRIRSPVHPAVWEMLSAIGLALLFAALSYRYIETPFRRRAGGMAQSGKAVLLASVAGAVTFVGLGFSGHGTNGFPGRSELYSRLAQNYGLDISCNGNSIDARECRSGESVQALLWGDSQAMHLALPLAMAQSETGVVQATLSACPPIAGYKGARQNLLTSSCEQFNQATLDYLLNKPNQIDRVYLASTFNVLIGQNGDDSIRKLGHMAKKIRDSGREVVLVSPSPQGPGNVAKCLKNMDGEHSYSNCDFSTSDLTPGYLDRLKVLQELADESGATFLDLRSIVCLAGVCRVYNQGKIMYRDAMHFSVESAQVLAPAFAGSPTAN